MEPCEHDKPGDRANAEPHTTKEQPSTLLVLEAVRVDSCNKEPDRAATCRHIASDETRVHHSSQQASQQKEAEKEHKRRIG